MSRFKNFKTAFSLSLVLLIVLSVMIYAFFYLTEINITFNQFLALNLLLIIFFFFSILLINNLVKRFILKKVKAIYNDLLPTNHPQNKNYIEPDMEVLNMLQKYADDKKLEIESLKDQENYRKEFLGNISHELKTPLFTIQGYVLTLLQGAIKDKNVREKYLKRTAKGVERLIYVVKDLDLITQFEMGTKTIDRTNFDIVTIIENYRRIHREMINNEINNHFNNIIDNRILDILHYNLNNNLNALYTFLTSYLGLFHLEIYYLPNKNFW